MKPEVETEKVGVTALDVRIMVSVLICCAVAMFLKKVGILFSYQSGETVMRLEIIQLMTSCISCLLCCQDNVKISVRAGRNRLIITAVGGAVGLVVAWIDTLIGSTVLLVLMVGAGVLLTLVLCKAAKVPYVNARIGGVTFVLVTCTLSGTARMWYALFRFVSTLFGAAVVVAVTWVFCKVTKEKE